VNVTDAQMERRTFRAELVTRVFLVFVTVVVTASLVLMAFVIQGNSDRGEENRATLKVIRDCTEPTGECYKRGQQASAAAVADINRVVIFAAACAAQSHHPSVSHIQQCVISRLAREHAR
jgi:hypothetical protein